MTVRLGYIIILLLLLASANPGMCEQLYIEPFTGEGGVNVVGWDSVYNTGSGGGVIGGFAWVWHDGNCGNIIYTHEYTVDTSTYSNIVFGFDLRRHSYYSTTPEVCIAVEVGGAWYVSKTVFVETTAIFQSKTLAYNNSKDNWDTLNITTLSRGVTAASDLSGNITGFGLYSNSQNVGSDCTAEYDNFTITGSLTLKSADFNSDRAVNFLDFAVMADAWLTGAGSSNYSEAYDLYDDNNIDVLDFAIFAQNWLFGSGYTFIPAETHREKIGFNTGWKFYKGNPGSAFEHIMMEEVGTCQGLNNWYFAASTSAAGPRDGLMTFYNDYLGGGWGSLWNYPPGGTWCTINDNRFVPAIRPPWRYMIASCFDANPPGYMPRLEWVSPYPDSSTVIVTGRAMAFSDVNNLRARILHNGNMIWESALLQPWNEKDEGFSFYIPDLNIGDILTFMPSSCVPWSNLRWLYVTIGENSADANAAALADFNDSAWQDVLLPHNPVTDMLWPPWPTLSYEGVSWYRKHFQVDDSYQGKKIFIEFEAANMVAAVWLNGEYLTTHYGGYLPFTIDITDKVHFGQTENIIAVKVDNRWNSDVPGENCFGGIYREVWLHITDKLYVTDAVYANKVAGGGIFVRYPSVTASQAEVEIKTNVLNESAVAKNTTVATFIVDSNGMVVAQATSTQLIASGADCNVTQSMAVTDPCLWHPDHPYLYTVHTQIYDAYNAADSYQTRIGIRSIEFTKAGGFKINGQTLRFRGANRAQDYPYTGFAMGNPGQRRDAYKLKEAGFQYVRTSCFRPNDPAFLDACDELGIMVLNPIPGSQFIGGAAFEERSYQTMRDLIRRDRNHPCVIAWELSLNETWWTDPNYTPTAMSIGHSEYPGNQCYIAGWKDGGMWGEPALYDIFIATPSAGARTYDGPLPLIVSEHGHWEYGGLSSTSDVHRGDGEAAMLQQAWNHQESHNLNRSLSNMCGDGVWVGMDYMTYPSGIMDKFRLPKFSYYFWQSQRDPNIVIPGLNSGSMVFIGNYWTVSSPTTVKVFSNCEQVKLYINDVPVATRNPDNDANSTNLLHPPFTFSGVTWASGELKAEGYIGGQVVATHVVKTPGAAASLDIRFDMSHVPPEANGDIIFVQVCVLDSNGTIVPDANNTITLAISSGPAYIVGPDQINAEAGIATFLIRTTNQSGEINISSTASGLIGDTAGITTQR